MFPVIFISLILSFVSMAALISGLWDHDMLQIKLSAMAFLGWVGCVVLGFVIEIKERPV